MAKKDPLKKTSERTRSIKLADGTRVPGSTTITGLLNKPFLITWANRLGYRWDEHALNTGMSGKHRYLAHAMIQAHLQGETLDLSIYSQRDIDLAENALVSILRLGKSHNMRPIIARFPLFQKYTGTAGRLTANASWMVCLPCLTSRPEGQSMTNTFSSLRPYEELLKEYGHP
jgi:hypothetical protein